MSDYVIAIEGLSILDDLESLSPKVIQAAQRAINATARRTRTSVAKEMREEVNFPARYLSGSSGKLGIKTARPGKLEAVITGRDRPTSLARFAKQRSGGVKVQVTPGATIDLNKAFLLRWANGAEGLAVRLSKGEALRNRRRLKQVASGLYVLYGPSVDQVFGTLAYQEVDDAARFLENEFARLMKLE